MNTRNLGGGYRLCEEDGSQNKTAPKPTLTSWQSQFCQYGCFVSISADLLMRRLGAKSVPSLSELQGNALVWDESGNCRGELTLTWKGKAHAKKIGEAFVSHGIKPMVISSPMCRCRETSQIAFGEYVTDPDLRETASADAQRQEIFQAKARTLLTKYRGAHPIVFVSHRPNIDSLTMELIDDGDLLVGSISETGEINVLGKIRLEP